MDYKNNCENLFKAIASIKNEEECRKVFEDLFTIKETLSLAQRLEVAQLLDQKEIYADIAEKTGASSATISRVARCLNYGSDGYKIILDRLKEDKNDE